MMELVQMYEPKLPLRSACSFFIVEYLCGVAEDGCDGYVIVLMVMMILAMVMVMDVM